MMEHTVLQFLQDRRLVSGGEHITVALSGGADSMALLTVLLQLQTTLHITVSAAHFHHGLRGEEAARDEDFVRQWCSQKGVALSVGHGDAKRRAEETGESIEEAARNLRYAFFDALSTDLIATAHTANDNAETLLLHLLRGTGPRGMCGIPAKRGRYIRPFLAVDRVQIEQYLSETGVPHMEDSTNAEDDCVRNRIRHRVMPELLRENPQFLSAVTRSTALQTLEETYLSELAQNAATACRLGDGYDCRKLRSLNPVLLRRVLLGELRAHRVENPSACYVEALEQLVRTDDPSASVSLPKPLLVRREYEQLVFSREEVTTFSPVTVPIPGKVTVPELSMRVSCFITENLQFYQKKADTICLKYDMMAQTVTLRPRRSGDALRLPGGTRTLKKRMIDCKIPAAKRALIPVIELLGEVVAADGLGISQSWLPKSEQPVLVIELQRRQSDGTHSTAP